jgi:hypothetical protein
LRADVEAAASLPGIDQQALEVLRAKLAGHVFNVVMGGEFKRWMPCSRPTCAAWSANAWSPTSSRSGTHWHNDLTMHCRIGFPRRRRLTRAGHEARQDMLQRFDATIASITTAIEKGRALKSRGEDAAGARERDIRAQLARIDAIAARSRLTLDSG